MFTGIVQEIGTVRHTGPNASGLRLEVVSSLVAPELPIDASVNVAGACLTVVEKDTHGFVVDIVAETLRRTTLGLAIRGTRVNLESAATPTTALGGHLVQGHVDATTKLMARREEGGGAARLRFALDGVSLTIAGLGKTFFEVALIPHTGERTTLGALAPGDLVNVETDVVAKYVERLVKKS